MKPALVVDSSVVVKWFVKEDPLESFALDILKLLQKGDYQFIVPDLLFYEVGNVFLKKWRNELEIIQKAFVRLWSLPWFLMPLRQSLLTRALEMAGRFQITFYDALFCATAEQANATLVTADEKMLSRVKSLPFIYLLHEFPRKI